MNYIDSQLNEVNKLLRPQALMGDEKNAAINFKEKMVNDIAETYLNLVRDLAML